MQMTLNAHNVFLKTTESSLTFQEFMHDMILRLLTLRTTMRTIMNHSQKVHQTILSNNRSTFLPKLLLHLVPRCVYLSVADYFMPLELTQKLVDVLKMARIFLRSPVSIRARVLSTATQTLTLLIKFKFERFHFLMINKMIYMVSFMVGLFIIKPCVNCCGTFTCPYT